jgi:PTS system nitrogen regulatory IIA component
MIELADLVSEERVVLDFEAGDSRVVLDELGRLLGGQDEAAREAIREDLVARERKGTTGVGGGVAFPHARVDVLPGLRIAVLRALESVDFQSLDGRKVDLFIAVAGPRECRRDYLSVLSRLSYLLRGEEVRARFRESRTAQDVVGLFPRTEESVPGRD